MVIENRLPTKQKAQSAEPALGLISIRMGVVGQCRHHQINHVSRTPAWVAALAGAESNTAEGVLDPTTPVSGNSAVDRREIHNDLPQLPFRMPEVRKAR